MLTLTVKPSGYSNRGQLFDGFVDGRLIVARSTQPLLDGCRVLVGEGTDPTTRIVMRHHGQDYGALRSIVKAGAKLTITEKDGAPTFRPWEAWSRRRDEPNIEGNGVEADQTPPAGKDALPETPRSEPRLNPADIGREIQLKIYCDTNTLPENADISEKESEALKQLQSFEGLKWFTSHIVRHEAANTRDESKRNRLLAEHEARERVPKDENVVGYNAQSDTSGGFVGFFLISDVQDEALRAELISRGLTRRDAEHITQAVCNDCDVFLTRDMKSIIIPHREWLETRFPKLKVLLPSELLAELTAPAAQTADLAGLTAARADE